MRRVMDVPMRYWPGRNDPSFWPSNQPMATGDQSRILGSATPSASTRQKARAWFDHDFDRRIVHCVLAFLLLPALLGVLAIGAIAIVALWFVRAVAALVRLLATALEDRPKC